MLVFVSSKFPECGNLLHLNLLESILICVLLSNGAVLQWWSENLTEKAFLQSKMYGNVVQLLNGLYSNHYLNSKLNLVRYRNGYHSNTRHKKVKYSKVSGISIFGIQVILHCDLVYVTERSRSWSGDVILCRGLLFRC